MKRTVCVLTVLAMVLLMPFSHSLAAARGDIVTFGQYPQGIHGEKEPVRWTVLKVENGYALLLSEKILDGKPFHDGSQYKYDVTWEECTLRTWLNEEFLGNFTSGEQQSIKETEVVTEANDLGDYSVSGGNPTQDRVFVLSIKEVSDYLPQQSERVAEPTRYAESRGVYTGWLSFSDDSGSRSEGNANAGIWWTRSPSVTGHTVLCISHLGNRDNHVYAGGYYNTFEVSEVEPNVYGVRPAMWVKTDALTPAT